MNNLTPDERVQQYEKNILASYAAYSAESRGRQYIRSEHPFRTPYQRDRDRVVHSAAFRRMEYKTQVFVNHEGDHYRTRLTHTLEVAQISRTIARSLGLNEDLAEAIALVHDLGHTPFGHSGEHVLNDLMSTFNGFNHNHQSLRIVDYLELRYSDFPGLNLTYEVREGIVKHETSADPIMPELFPPDEGPTLEAALVDLADTIAYNCHDIDDGVRAGLVDIVDLEEIPLIGPCITEVKNRYPELATGRLIHESLRRLISLMVEDVIASTRSNISSSGISSIHDIRASTKMLAGFSPRIGAEEFALKEFLRESLYRHPKVDRIMSDAENVVTDLFREYFDTPKQMPDEWLKGWGNLDENRKARRICDFVAGMTDRYALLEHERLFDATPVLR